MSQPARSRRSVRLMCSLAAVILTIAGSLKDDEVEVVTLGALHPPLVSPVRPSGGGGHAEARLDKEESPDETIARLLRHMFERESQHLLHGEELEGLSTEMPPAPAPTGAADDADDATAETQRPIRTDDSRVYLEEEKVERRVPGSAAAAEVGQARHNQQQQEEEEEGGLDISSHSGLDLPTQGLDGNGSNGEEGAGGVKARAAGVSNDVGVDHVEGGVTRDASGHVDGDGEDEETSGGASATAAAAAAAAASEAGDAPARDVLLEEPEDSSVAAKVLHARQKETPGAVAAGSGEEAVVHEMTFGQGSDERLAAAASVVDEGGGGEYAGIGAFVELEDDGGVAQEQEAAADGEQTGAKEPGTDAGVEGDETGSGDDGSSPVHAVGLNTEWGERVAVKGELEAGADSTLSRDTPLTATQGSDGQHAAVIEEREEFGSIASTPTTMDGAAPEATAEAEAAAEATSIDEAAGMPDSEFVAGSGDLIEESQAQLPDVIDEETSGAAVGRVSLGEVSSLSIDGDEKEDVVPAAEVMPASVSADGGGGNEEQESDQLGEEIVGLGSSGDSEPARDADSPPSGGDGEDVAAGVEQEGEIGLGGQQSATLSTSSESAASEERGNDFRPPEEGRAAPAVEATDGDGIVEPLASNEPGTAVRPAELTAAQQAGGEAPPAEGGPRGEEEPPRPRPVFRFSEPLSSAPDVDLGLAGKLTADMFRDAENDDGVLDFPPLPPIDALPGLGAQNDGAGADADSAEGGSGGGWWATWGEKLGTAARNKISRWASEAAERGGVLANMLVEECIARVTKSWHETIEPQTEYARRRLEDVAEFCVAEVADHLSDPVLAEAL